MPKPRTHRMRVATDTATLAIFDPARLRHRLNDPVDWWTVWEWVVAEMNAGNMLAINLQADGVYDVTIHLDVDCPAESEQTVGGLIACGGQAVYIGPGEQVVGGGLTPDESLDGIYLPIAPGTYRVRVARHTDELEIWLESVTGSAQNAFADYPRL
jgi:hypothetical protein